MIPTSAVTGAPATETAILTGMKGRGEGHLGISIEGPQIILDRSEAKKKTQIPNMRITTVIIEEKCLRTIGGMTYIDHIRDDQDQSMGLMDMTGRMTRKK